MQGFPNVSLDKRHVSKKSAR